jgi:hypothetical protein
VTRAGCETRVVSSPYSSRLPILFSSHESQQMLGLLRANVREWQEIARLDSGYENYRAGMCEFRELGFLYS